jgi:hypothetical protein
VNVTEGGVINALAQLPADDRLEMEILATGELMLLATDRDDKRRLFDLQRELIAQRSPQQVARMDRERGLV